ncbi:GSCFA domain-containing protein [Hymenobacter sp. BT188]|uniref:GSCFA domain-containing protein n=1 Tax=Hymenobacter sp. BT188 TaxID=2763504 RepID=UPI00165154E8|nr:GSCFA domain-containing protein [Hymenobacter sp. BT188]MBC6606655.1 GSCFA domain-containing protein [Hymenobacter sp. BT188]
MFRTEIPLTPHPTPFSLAARVLTIGSCFSDVLGNRLSSYKVRSLANPFGTVFNPLSACKLLRAAAGEETDWQQHLVPARGRWQSYDLHAAVGSDSPVELLQHIQDLMQRTGQFLETADVVVLTLGTAYAYRLRETQEIVSNCHKVPADQFEKELLTPDEIINAIAETHALLRRRNPKLRFVLTVSPVRHIKDTLPLNAVSKSILRVACHYLSELLPDVTYFPAYELLMDDLRDYRFYAADMIHPSAVAEEYVWERFSREYFDSNFGRFQKEWDAVRQAMAHRPLYPAAPEHRQFLEATLTRLQRLGNQVDVRPEIREVQKQLHSLPVPLKPLPVPVPEADEDQEERIDIGEPENTPQRVISPAVVASPPTAYLSPALNKAVSEGAIPEVTEAAPFKKKRRSRGGAKRSGRKKAAQLAASLANSANDELPIADDSSEQPEIVDAAVEMPPSLPIETTDYTDTIVEASIQTVAAEEQATTEVPESEITSAATPTPASARPKRRTAAQVKAAKTSRKPTKTVTAKAESKPRTARPARRKPTGPLALPAVEQSAPMIDAAGLPAIEVPTALALETSPIKEKKAAKASPKRRARPPRKKPTPSADQPTSET